MNFIDIALRNDNVTDIAKLTAKILCNALTGALVRETEQCVRDRTRFILDDGGERSEPTTEVPSIDDQTNLEPETSDGMSITQAAMTEVGYEVSNPYHNMCTLNGLRHFVYNDMFRYVDIPLAKDALYTTKARKAGSAINWDQPMSAEQFLDFRIKLAGNVNEYDLRAAVAEDPQSDAAYLRQLFQTSALRRQAALKDTRLDILSEIMSLPEVCHDVDGFKVTDTRTWDSLPIKLRVTTATKVRDNMQKEHDRLQTIRTEKMAGLRTLIRAEIGILEAALNALVRKARTSDDA